MPTPWWYEENKKMINKNKVENDNLNYDSNEVENKETVERFIKNLLLLLIEIVIWKSFIFTSDEK